MTRSWRRRGLFASGGLGLSILAALGGSVAFVRLSAAGRIYPAETAPAKPVALVLGAQVYPSGRPSPFLAARLDLAKRLYDRGVVGVILVSGDSKALEYDEPTAMRDYLIEHGVPAHKVVADHAGFDTYDSCARAKRIFGIDSLVVVSQSYHIPRAVATCRWLGIDAVGVGDDSVSSGPAWRVGAVRDQLACVKAVVDLVTRRDPVLGSPESGVHDALAS